MKKFIYFLPRVLGIILGVYHLILFIGSFRFDFILTTFFALASTIFAWNKPKIGGIAFFGFWFFYTIKLGFVSKWNFTFMLKGEPFLVVFLIIGILFLIEGFRKK